MQLRRGRPHRSWGRRLPSRPRPETCRHATAPDTPSAHLLAVAKFKLRIWEQWDGGDLELVSPDLELQGGTLEWTGTARPEAGTPLPLVLHVAVIDPLGRESVLVKLTAA